MKCIRKGCKKEAKPGKMYCGMACSRYDNKERYFLYTGIKLKETR